MTRMNAHAQTKMDDRANFAKSWQPLYSWTETVEEEEEERGEGGEDRIRQKVKSEDQNRDSS